MRSKEDNILELFFENPTKEWHFNEILKKANITRSKANKWLIYFQKENFIKKIKEKGKMPYYISNYESSSYKSKKRAFTFNKLYESGFLTHLNSLPKAKTIIIFGSFVRSDWYKTSDIDVFIYGDPKGLKTADYELKLNKNVQLFICKDKTDLKKLGKGLIRNIIKGNLIKGNLDFVRVEINA